MLSFAEIEADGGRDLARAAERTGDPLLRRLYLVHASDEQRHATLLRGRGIELLSEMACTPGTTPMLANAFTPGERGLDDLRIDQQSDDELLAFLHLSEKTATVRFGQYCEAMPADPGTRAVLGEILQDETFHMKYTAAQLQRVAPGRHRKVLWRARFGRIWKAYLRFAVALAGGIGSIVLTLEYFLLLGPFALLAKRGARREPEGWRQIPRRCELEREY